MSYFVHIVDREDEGKTGEFGEWSDLGEFDTIEECKNAVALYEFSCLLRSRNLSLSNLGLSRRKIEIISRSSRSTVCESALGSRLTNAIASANSM